MHAWIYFVTTEFDCDEIGGVPEVIENLGGWSLIKGMGRFTSIAKYASTRINRWPRKREAEPSPVIFIHSRHASDTSRPL